MIKLLVVGSINMDLILRMEKIPSAGESMLCDTYRYAYGGKGANQAVAAARLGAETTFAGKVGDDPVGGELAGSLKALGIKTCYLTEKKGSGSGLAVIALEGNGQNRIMIFPESNMSLRPEDVDEAFQDSYDAMLVQFEIPRDVVIHACKAAAGKGIPFIVDAGPAQDFPIESIPGAEIFTPNESETYAMCGIDVVDLQSASFAAKLLKDRSGARYVVIKAGGNGAYLYDGRNTKHFAANKVTPVDTTAAGDAFTAAMAVEYLKSGSIESAITFAGAAGAVAVTRLGAQPSLPTLGEVEAFIKSHT